MAFTALLIGVVLEVVPASDAFSGFGHPATIIVALVLVVSAGLARSGAIFLITRSLLGSDRSLPQHITLMGGVGAVLSAFMNNMAALALLMPVDIQAAKKAGRAARLSLMPLSFCTILGGMVTLIGTASKADETNDWSVCSTWRVRGKSAWFLDLHRVRLEFPELRRRIQSLYSRWNAQLILIEEAGSGVQLIQDLKENGAISVRGIVPKDDKATRLLSVSHLIEGGQIVVPDDAPWLAEFQREGTLFPNGKFDDQVDSLSQFLIWLTKPKTEPRIRAL